MTLSKTSTLTVTTFWPCLVERNTPFLSGESIFEHTYPLSNPVVNNWSVQYLKLLCWQPALRPFPQRHSSCCALHSRALHLLSLSLPPKWARSAPLRPPRVPLPPCCPGPSSLRSLEHNALFESNEGGKDEGTSVRALPVCWRNV